jgi:hypothetical protein
MSRNKGALPSHLQVDLYPSPGAKSYNALKKTKEKLSRPCHIATKAPYDYTVQELETRSTKQKIERERRS